MSLYTGSVLSTLHISHLIFTVLQRCQICFCAVSVARTLDSDSYPALFLICYFAFILWNITCHMRFISGDSIYARHPVLHTEPCTSPPGHLDCSVSSWCWFSFPCLSLIDPSVSLSPWNSCLILWVFKQLCSHFLPGILSFLYIPNTWYWQYLLHNRYSMNQWLKDKLYFSSGWTPVSVLPCINCITVSRSFL